MNFPRLCIHLQTSCSIWRRSIPLDYDTGRLEAVRVEPDGGGLGHGASDRHAARCFAAVSAIHAAWLTPMDQPFIPLARPLAHGRAFFLLSWPTTEPAVRPVALTRRMCSMRRALFELSTGRVVFACSVLTRSGSSTRMDSRDSSKSSASSRLRLRRRCGHVRSRPDVVTRAVRLTGRSARSVLSTAPTVLRRRTV